MNEIDDIKKLIDLMVERKDVYITIYYGENGKSISIYPLIDDEEEKKNSDVISNIDLDNVDLSKLVGASKNVLYELGKVLVEAYKPEEEIVNKYDITIDVKEIGEYVLKANEAMSTLVESLKEYFNSETETPEAEDDISVEEMRLHLHNYCKGLNNCTECPLFDNVKSFKSCDFRSSKISDSQIREIYKKYKKVED